MHCRREGGYPKLVEEAADVPPFYEPFCLAGSPGPTRRQMDLLHGDQWSPYALNPSGAC